MDKINKIILPVITVISVFGGIISIANFDLIKEKEHIVEINYCEDCLSYEEFIEVIEILDEQAKIKKQVVDITTSKQVIDKLVEGADLTEREKLLIEKAKK